MQHKGDNSMTGGHREQHKLSAASFSPTKKKNTHHLPKVVSATHICYCLSRNGEHETKISHIEFLFIYFIHFGFPP